MLVIGYIELSEVTRTKATLRYLMENRIEIHRQTALDSSIHSQRRRNLTI